MSLNKEATKKPVRPHTEHALLTSTTSTSTAPSRSKKSSNPQSARERSTGSSSGGVKMYYDATCAQPPHEPASAVVVPASSNRSVAPHVLSQFISKVGQNRISGLNVVSSSLCGCHNIGKVGALSSEPAPIPFGCTD